MSVRFGFLWSYQLQSSTYSNKYRFILIEDKELPGRRDGDRCASHLDIADTLHDLPKCL